jgi:Flp pilus assembly protein CpaB
MGKTLRGILFAILGIALIGLGIFAISLLLQRSGPQVIVQPTPIPTVKTTVVVVTHDMFLGDLIDAADVTTVDVPVELVPRDAVTDVNAAVDKFVKADLVQGEMVLQHNLADPTNNQYDISFILSDDHVLLAFPAGDLMSSNSIIKRGDIVDIFATISAEVQRVGTTEGSSQPAATEEPPTVEMITIDAYQALEITALVADIFTEENAPPPSVTNPPTRSQVSVRAYLLALNPQDALLLKYLVDSGADFDMVLRAPPSHQTFELTPITSEYIVELYGLNVLP